jgi:hypothetical protein
MPVDALQRFAQSSQSGLIDSVMGYALQPQSV